MTGTGTNCIFCKNYGNCPVEKERDGRQWMLHSNGLNGLECAEYIPCFIDTVQYWERTGAECGDDMPVWYRFVSNDGTGKPFELKKYGEVKDKYGGFYGTVCIVIANELGMPPNSWMPKDTI